MRFLSTLSTLFTLSSISLVAAAPSDLLTTTKIIPCGNTNVKPDPTVEAALSGVVAELQRTAGKVVGLVDDVVGGLLPRQSSTKNINVYWHTIREGTTAAQGTTTSAQISASIQRLNQYLTPLGFRFTLASTDVTTNADWFNNAGPDTPQQTAMKNALRKGAARDLNVYTVAFNSGEVQGLLGYGTFPWSYSGAPKDDGVSMNYRAMPSGSLNGYNVNAGTLVHETGHWLGLYHTFQGGCSDTAGDYVSDTAAESEPHFSCSSSSDSCPNLPGADPLSNFMSYTPDNCKTLFTSGQGQRAIAACQTYRGL